jgi:putative transposase
MVKKAYTPEQIINKLREAEIMLSQGATLAVIWRRSG